MSLIKTNKNIINYVINKFWKKITNKRPKGLTQWRFEHISNFRQTLKTKMRPKGMICQILLLTLKLCSFYDFQFSFTRFSVHLLPNVSTRFCKFEQNCFTGFDFIRQSLGPVIFETACTSDNTTYEHVWLYFRSILLVSSSYEIQNLIRWKITV